MSDAPFRMHPPENLINCVIAEKRTVDALLADLEKAGYSGDEKVLVLHGEADLKRIDPDGTEHGGFARFMRAFQKFTTGVDERVINAAEEALSSGQYMVGVISDGSEAERDEIYPIMQKHGGTRIFFAQRGVTQLISGW